MKQSEKNKVFLKLIYDSQNFNRSIRRCRQKSTPERTKIVRDEQIDVLEHFMDQKWGLTYN